MLKRVFFVFAVILSIITASLIVYADESAIDNLQPITQNVEEVDDSFVDEPISTPKVDTIDLNDQMFFDKISTKNLNKFKALKAVVVNKTYDEQDLSAYNYFISSLNPNDAEIDYINQMISSGYPIDVLVQIYEYWKDTAEDLDIIEEVFINIPEDYQTNKYWIDDAFLNLSKQGKTKVVFSDLSVADVREYVENGYTYDDLIFAERLSRKGVLTIEQILQNRGNGKSWNDILETIYDIDFNEATAQQIDNMNLSVHTLKIIDTSRAESAQNKLNAESPSTIDSLFVEKLFNGYNEYVVNAKIIRDLKF